MATHSSNDRVTVDGKFFRLGSRKFFVKGVTYGPFAPNDSGEYFPDRGQTARDLALIRELGANVVRLYYVPPEWFFDLAGEYGLKLFIDIPWARHLCFLDSETSRKSARLAVREAVTRCQGHLAVFAFSVVNEISAEIVRWSGVRQVERFIDELVAVAREGDPGCLCTFASFPPTEFLRSETIDFVCFNVYLHERQSFSGYLDRLQTLADSRPLVLGEFGMDSGREGEERKSEFLAWQIELACRAGVAGTVLFSFTDDWFRGGYQVTDWAFGITTRERQRKPSFEAVQRQYGIAPYFPIPHPAKVSVVVATYNGARTLRSCLESLMRLNYPDYEVIVVDDGSQDQTPEIVREFPSAHYIRQQNQGLSAARNAGIRAARGEIIAFTDDDCRADEDWLYYLIADLQLGNFQGIGGHNFLPPEDSPVAAAVVVSPGGPAHVLVTDREAEHVPGCNMAFYTHALEQVGLFEPLYRKAGDDVDICWRMQESGLRIGFSPAGFVWHYRRSTVKAYLKQQAGYGEAEALLMRTHPEHYNALGAGLWRGRIYASAYSGLLLRGPVIYRGVFASGLFQRLYTPDPITPLLLCTGLGYHLGVTVPLAVLSAYFPAVVPLAIASFSLSLGSCAVAAFQARLPSNKKRIWSRPLVALLFLLQPIVRGWARLKWRLNPQTRSRQTQFLPLGTPEVPVETTAYWTTGEVNRLQFLHEILKVLEASAWVVKTDTGWTDYDLETPAHLWSRLRLTTVTEELEGGKRCFRVRIEGAWSLAATAVFWGAALLTVFAIERAAEIIPWVWLALTPLPILAWWFDDQVQTDAAVLQAMVDDSARTLKLIKIPEAAQPARQNI